MSKKNRKRKLDEEMQSSAKWEESIIPDEVKSEMETMWEIPQTYHFLHLAKEILNIPYLSLYEVERMLMIPRASKQLANIMTSLLSSPLIKPKLRKIPAMPYEFWTNILAHKMKTWFQVYERKLRDTVKVFETIGVEPEFWNVFPDAVLLNGKEFEDLSFKQKVWLLKTVCDTVMYTRRAVQDAIAKQQMECQFETRLGTDRNGARYIYFPQFLNTDLRIYRICLDNKILSTVKPVKVEEVEPKLEVDANDTAAKTNDLAEKKVKLRRTRYRWKNGCYRKTKKGLNRFKEKNPIDFKDNSDGATNPLTNDDTNLSSTSSFSNNNDSNSNNNNVHSDTINENRSEDLSTCSEISIQLDDQSHCNSTKSNGYDVNNPVDTDTSTISSDNIFKGFPNDRDDKCNLEINDELQNDVKSDAGADKKLDVDVPLIHNSQSTLSSTKPYMETMDLCITGDEPADRNVDSLSNVSKTDDEKLNEIISAESLKLNDTNPNNSHTATEIEKISNSSKSDDEKLSETRTTSNHVTEPNSDDSENLKNNDEVREENELHPNEQTSNCLVPDVKRIMHPEQSSESPDNAEVESNDNKDFSLNELRSILQKEAMQEDGLSFNDDSVSNLETLEDDEIHVWKKKLHNFNKMLQELNVSEFQLVADSVSSLKDLISTFSKTECDTSQNENNSDDDDTDDDKDEYDDNETTSKCEVRLVKKLKELLSSVEKRESALQESTLKARGRLQREWQNFKDAVEDQDSSGEGLGSNWWVLGSQGFPLSTPVDATLLQTVPQATLPRIGTPSVSRAGDDNGGRPDNRTECNNLGRQECRDNDDGNTRSESRGNQSESGEGCSQENAETEEEYKEDCTEGEQTRRVLRRRGVSSYTEQFYSDDEVEENELEVWTDVEAVYAAPSAQADPSPSYLGPKVKNTDDRKNEEDSDQDWILPSSRKRKHKRPSASRRLKSFQYKLQSINIDELQNAAESVVPNTSSTKSCNQKPKIKDVRIYNVNGPSSSKSSKNSINNTSSNNNTTIQSDKVVVRNNPKETVPSTNEQATSELGNVESVHSELDIKDEGPIYENLSQYENGYAVTQNYVMVKADENSMNYYVMESNGSVVPQNTIMQPGPIISSIISPVQQGYYVQGGQNYIIQNPQSQVMPPQPLQPQGPQMITPQQFVAQTGYVPYMVTTTQSQSGFVGPQIVAQQMPRTVPVSVPVQPNATLPVRPPQVRQPVPRQSHPPLNGAVIRSSPPIRAHHPRVTNPKTAKTVQSPRRPAPKTVKPKTPSAATENAGKKTTSVIVLSDSDDEIEMIITEKNESQAETEKTRSTLSKQTSADETTIMPKGGLPPQIIQRMNQGGISITPIKPAAPPVQNSNTQLVVVVNETGSHYALALPNGSKLILTPEQVAQIRASNGGKLIL